MMTRQGKTKARANVHDRYIGERVKYFRELKGMTQDDLGGAVGVSFQQIQKYEDGRNRMSAVRLMQVGKVLGVEHHEFVPPTLV